MADEVAESTQDAQEPRKSPGPGRRLLWIGVAALVVAIAFAGWAGFSWWRAADDDALRYAQARDEVLDAGRAHVTTLTTLDYHDLDGGIAGWLEVSTGPLRDELASTDERTKTTIRDAGTVATGRVLDAAVSELDERAGTAKLLVSVEIATQQQDATAATKRNRFVAGLSRTDGEWKLSALDQVPLGAQEGESGMSLRIKDVEPDLADEDLDDDVDDDVEFTDDTDEPGDGRRAWRRVAVGLLVLAVLVAGAGGWFLYRAQSLRSAPSAANTALVDTGRTAEVSAAVTTGLNRVFSYSYDKTADTENAATAILRGDAAAAYDKLFADVRRLAPDQKLVLTTRVVSAAVQSIEGDTARVLVFLDQSATRADTGTANAAAAQLSVTAEKDGDRWVITDLEPR